MWLKYGVNQAVRSVSMLGVVRELSLRNRHSSETIPTESADNVVISMTTHGPRLRWAFYALESLIQGSVRAPILLWLDRTDYEAPWPASLQRLARRGVQVRCSDGAFGPHTKYWGTFREAAPGTRVVTADDDVIYPPWFLERLLAAAQQDPHAVIAHRAHEITVVGGRLQPYRRWRPVATSEPSARHFATGVSGVLYPASLVDYVAGQGEDFLQVCPRADDIWLNLCALRSGHPVRQVSPIPQDFWVIPLTQVTALSYRNTFLGGNDEQLEQAYESQDILQIKAQVK